MTFVTKKALPRRTFLGGMGVTVGLPLLEAMIPAVSAQTPAASIRRLGFLYVPNGVSMNHLGANYWKPTAVGSNFELSPILASLAPFRDQLTVVSGMSLPQAESLGDGSGDHTRACSVWLNGVHPKKTEGADVRAGTTADQIAAEVLGKETALPSLELGIDLEYLVGIGENGYSQLYQNTISWRTPTTPASIENIPRIVFERLFGDGSTATERLSGIQTDRSILDDVAEEMSRLLRRLGVGDQARSNEYFEAIREVERRIQKLEKNFELTQPPPDLAQPPVGIPEKYDDHVKLMFDLQWLAYQADLTRVFTFMFGRELGGRPYPELDISDGHHAASHHGNRPEDMLRLAKLNAYHVDLFAYFLKRLQSTPEGDGTLLDHTLMLYGAGLSDSQLHSHVDVPLAVAGGGSGQVKGGRHIAVAGNPPMSNLLVSMLDKVGVHRDRLGDSTGRLNFSDPDLGDPDFSDPLG